MEATGSEKPNCPMGRLIYMLSHQMKRRSFTQEDDWGLTMTQKHVLKFILMESLNRDIFQKDVEEEFQVRRSTATGMLKLMEKNGFIIRENVVQDARLKKIIPTGKAEKLREEIFENIRETEQILCEGIPEKALEQCGRVLWKMFLNLSEMEALKPDQNDKEVGRPI